MTERIFGTPDLAEGLTYFHEKYPQFSKDIIGQVGSLFNQSLPISFDEAVALSKALQEMYDIGTEGGSSLWNPGTKLLVKNENGIERSDYHELGELKNKLNNAISKSVPMETFDRDLLDLIREFVILELGPIASDDGEGMVNFTRPTTDPDDIEDEFDRNQFMDMTRRAYKDARSREERPDVKKLTIDISDRQRKLTGIEIDQEDLESELGHAEKEQDEFGEADPETKAQYYADPKWYTKYF